MEAQQIFFERTVSDCWLLNSVIVWHLGPFMDLLFASVWSFRSQNDADEYSIEFVFDADAPLSVTLSYQAVEIVSDGNIRWVASFPCLPFLFLFIFIFVLPCLRCPDNFKS